MRSKIYIGLKIFELDILDKVIIVARKAEIHMEAFRKKFLL